MDMSQDRKKRKWDVPGPTPVVAAAPSILGQPFFAGPTNVGTAVANQLLQKYHQLGMGQPGPVGAPGGSAAEEIRRKINQTLIQRGIIAGPKADDSALEKEIVINDAPPGIRTQLTRRPVQEEIQRETGAVIITRGRYKPPGAPLDDREKPLHLHISPGAHLPNEIAKQRAVEHAAGVVEDILKGGPGLRPRQGLAMHTLFLHVGIEADPGFGLAARIRGENNAYLDHISNESGAVLELRGRGSGTSEGPERKEKDEPLQLVLMCSTAAGLDQAKKLANNLLDTIRADWEAYSKPAAAASSAAPAAPQYPPYYYGYPYPPYPGVAPPYGTPSPYLGFYPPTGPSSLPPPASSAAPQASAAPQIPPQAGAPSSSEQYQLPPQAPATGAEQSQYPQAAPVAQASGTPSHAGSTLQSSAALPQATQGAGYAPAPYVPPQEDKRGMPPPPPDSRPPPPQSPAQTAPSSTPYPHMGQPQQQQAPFSTPAPYGPPDLYQPRQSAAPATSAAPPPPSEASPPPPPEAVPPPPSEEAPPDPPMDAGTKYQGYQYPQYPPPAQQAPSGTQYTAQGQAGEQGLSQGHYGPPSQQHAGVQGQYAQQGRQVAQYPPPTQYTSASGGYAAPAANDSGYIMPMKYPMYPPPQSTQPLPPPSQQQQQQYQPVQTSFQSKPASYPPQGYAQAQGQYQQGPRAQGPPAAYNGSGSNTSYLPQGALQGGGYPGGGTPQRPPPQQQAPEGEKKRKFQEFPTNGRGPPPQETPKSLLGQAPQGYGPPPGQGVRGGPNSGMGLMGPPPPRNMGPPPLRGARPQMGPPMNRPPVQTVQAYGLKLVDYGEEEEEEAFRGNPSRPPHMPPQGGQGGPRPFWRPRT